LSFLAWALPCAPKVPAPRPMGNDFLVRGVGPNRSRACSKTDSPEDYQYDENTARQLLHTESTVSGLNNDVARAQFGKLIPAPGRRIWTAALF
jgi:hypothetical protein